MNETELIVLQETFPEISSEKINLMAAHLDAVLQANKTTNLTRIADGHRALLLHLEDSLIGLPELNAAPAGEYADIGSGGGFPGVPLALASGRSTLLVDSVKKKMEILDSIIANLGLSNQIAVCSDRIEELAIEQPERFSVLTARALSSLPSLLELASPLLPISGQLICYKAQLQEDELEQAKSIEAKVGMKLLSDRTATLSDKITHRRILVFEKASEPTVKLPRRPGMAQKRPYMK